MKIKNIVKRDGSIQPFNARKIVSAITKAGTATGEFGNLVALEIYDQQVLPTLETFETPSIDIEKVQDIVEKALFDTAFEETYKAFAIYRSERKKAREKQKAIVDVESSINEYVNQDDWRVKANANQGYSLGGMILNVSGKVVANYWLSTIYPKEVGLAHRNGDFHIHDLDMLSGYCCGHSLRSLLTEGFNGVPNKVSSNPPKHLSSALSQAVNFLGTLQNEWAGAQAFSSFDTYLAPFIKIDNLSYEEVKQRIQEFIFNLNVPSRWGTQTPFTNLTFDIHCPDDLRDQHPIIGGEEVDFTYGELQKEMDMINRAYIEVMTEGDAQGRVFTFPIPTYNITDDFDWDSENSKLLFEMTAKYGLPYFQNFMNSDLDPHMIRSMCPLGKDTEIRVRFKDYEKGEYDRIPIKALIEVTEPFQVLYKDKWVDAKLVDSGMQFTKKLTFSNAETVVMGCLHLQPVVKRNGKLETVYCNGLKVGDKVPFDYGVETITKIEAGSYEHVYCLAVDNDSHLFSLANGLITHNCRLRLDLTELLHRGNGLFGSAEQTGSVGVVTINCARLGYLYKHDWDGLLKRFDYLCDLAKTSLELKRKTITRLMKEGLYPYTQRYLGSFKNFFSTIGVNGVNEMLRNFSDDEYDITTVIGHEKAVELLQHLNKKVQQYQAETGNLYNSEATPAEGTATRFAREDRKRFPDIIQAGADGERYYTNSSQLPVGFTDDPFEALDHQEDLQRLYLGGCCEKGTNVLTNYGTLPIEDIVNNWKKYEKDIHTIAYDKEEKKWGWYKVTDAMAIDVAKHDKIKVIGERGFNVVTSDWHPFFVVQDDETVVEKRADELKKGDRLLQNNFSFFEDNPETTSESSEKLMYCIGHFIGNGSLSETRDNRGGNNIRRVHLRFDDGDKNIIERVQEYMNSLFDLNCKARWHGEEKRADNYYTYATSTSKATDFFEGLGFKTGPKAKTVRITKEVKKMLNQNQKLALALFAGLVDSDGYVNPETGDFEYSTASENLAKDVVELCTLLGMCVGYSVKTKVRENESALYRIRISNIELSKYINEIPCLTKIVCPEHQRDKRNWNVLRVREVSKVDVDDNQFYDLTVDKVHNYLAGKGSFVSIHNTVLHLYMGERVSTWKAARDIVKKTFSHYQLPYITITPTFSICPKHGYIAGAHEFCPKCDAELVARKRREKKRNATK